MAFIGNTNLLEINNYYVEKYKTYRLETIAKTSINIELKHLKAAFSIAVKWGFIQKNPVKVVKQLKLDSRLQTYLEPHEIEKFLNVIDKKEYKFNYFNSSYWFSFLGAMKKLAQVGFKGLIMPIGAREAGTGNAVASVLMGANSIFWNPAAITEISGNKSFAFNYMNWLADIKHGAGAVVFGMENIGLSTCSKYFSHI